MKTSLFILALFLGDEVSALQFRPYVNGRTPWYKSPPKTPEVGFPHDYFVPNFGLDHDVISTIDHKNQAENKLGHKWAHASFKPAPIGHPVDYFVPNFGQDRDVKITQKNIGNAEENLGHKWVGASFKPPPSPPQDYFVPNFGADRDIVATQEHAAAQESRLHHKWVTKAEVPAPKPHPTDYFVPNFGLDHDIKVSLKNTASQEAIHGSWNPDFVQAEEDIRMTSDPICSSAGCDQYKHKKKDLGYDINYPVPNLGIDRDIEAHNEDLELAERMLHHHLIMGTKESKAKWKNPAKKTLYDFSPKLDRDMRDSDHSLDITEDRLMHKFTPWN